MDQKNAPSLLTFIERIRFFTLSNIYRAEAIIPHLFGKEEKDLRGLRKWFVLLFILSIFVGVAHELEHDHHHDETCEVCLLAHTPALLDTPAVAIALDNIYDRFSDPVSVCPSIAPLSCRNRSPPRS